MMGTLIVLTGVIIQVVPTVDQGMYVAGRFLAGFGYVNRFSIKQSSLLTLHSSANLAQGSAPLLITELAHPAHRGKITTMYNTLWYLGSIIAAWTVYGTQNYTTSAAWRIPTGVQAAMPVILLLLVFVLPESPRWLISKGRTEQARSILIKYHAAGIADDPFVNWEYNEIFETLELEKYSSKKYGWSVFVKTGMSLLSLQVFYLLEEAGARLMQPFVLKPEIVAASFSLL